MKPHLLVLTLLLAGPAAAAEPAAKTAAKVTVEVLLNKLSAKKNRIGALKPAAAVTPSRTIVIEDEGGMIDVAWGGVRRIEGIGGLDLFDYTSDGVFVGIRAKELLYLSKDKGTFRKLVTLPSAGMGLAMGRDKIYLFERNGSGGQNDLFVLFPGKKALRLFDSPQPIDAVLEDGDRLLFSSGGAIFQFSPDKTTSLVFGRPNGPAIVSLTMNPKTRAIYGSDGASVFAVKGDKVQSITRENGGVLRWLDDGLLILDTKAPLLARLVGLP